MRPRIGHADRRHAEASIRCGSAPIGHGGSERDHKADRQKRRVRLEQDGIRHRHLAIDSLHDGIAGSVDHTTQPEQAAARHALEEKDEQYDGRGHLERGGQTPVGREQSGRGRQRRRGRRGYADDPRIVQGIEKAGVSRGLTDDQIRDALGWLEDNPPQQILLPHVVEPKNRAIAYRNKGNVQNRKKPKDKVSAAAAYIATAYEQHPESGYLLTWLWNECPSSTVSGTLNQLCNEVPYLGEACSPVELGIHEDYVFPVDAEKQI